MGNKKEMNSPYITRKLKFFEHQNHLYKIANRDVEEKLWEKELTLFDRNAVISNQVQVISYKSKQIEDLKGAIAELGNARSVRLARYVKNRLMSLIPSKKNMESGGEKINLYSIENNIAKMEEQVQELRNSDNISNYSRLWMNQLPGHRQLTQYKENLKATLETPKISIILPVYNVHDRWLTKAIESVLGQIYQNWELCIVDDASSSKKIPEVLNHFAGLDSRIKVKFNEENSGISRTSNIALNMATGEYVTFLDHDDHLSPNALFEVFLAIKKTGADFIYSDEALVSPLNKIVSVLFKPDFSPDFLLSLNYINHMMVIRKNLIEKTGGFRDGIEGAQDYDIALKTTEIAEKIHHIHKILYFWRISEGTFSSTTTNKRRIHNAGQRAIEMALNRRKVNAEIFQAKRIFNYHVKRKIKNNPKASIIIPFKDEAEVLSTCLESIIFNTAYENFEIIGISNNSTKNETFNTMRDFESLDDRIHFLEYDIPFNYSKINNHGVSKATGEHIVLMNNDIEVLNSDWLEELLQHSQRAEVGVVGGKLYYPNNTIQHAGVITGIAGFAGHSHRHYAKDSDGSMNRMVTINNVSAVTGALLMVKKSLFLEVEGLDEVNLQVALNDVDFCLKIREKGYINIFTPYCEAYHYESKSRGYDTTLEQKDKFEKERDYFVAKWTDILSHDPYYNQNLTLEREDFSQRGELERINCTTASSFME